MKNIECDGTCNRLHTCKGLLFRVHVVDTHDVDWGEFWYCNMAIELDEENDFNVTILGEYITR